MGFKKPDTIETPKRTPQEQLLPNDTFFRWVKREDIDGEEVTEAVFNGKSKNPRHPDDPNISGDWAQHSEVNNNPVITRNRLKREDRHTAFGVIEMNVGRIHEESKMFEEISRQSVIYCPRSWNNAHSEIRGAKDTKVLFMFLFSDPPIYRIVLHPSSNNS